jgi:putative inorganic carbon (hco3(-)) transporter
VRDILLSGVVLSILPYALRMTWVAVLLWTWFSVMNPHRLAYGFANTFPFAAIAAGAALLSLIWNLDKVRLPKDLSVWLLITFVLWLCFATSQAINVDFSLDILSITLKIQLMTLISMAALRERKHIEYFIWVNVLSLGFYGAKGGLFGILTGGSHRVWGPAGSLIEGNNELGLALVMIIPFMNFLRQVSSRVWVRHGLLLMMLLSVVAVVSTQSRGALLAVLAMGLVLWTRTKKKVLTMVISLGLGFSLVWFMPATWESRMQTIGNYEEDTSAMQRLNSWETAINVANDRLTGAGFAIATTEIFARYAPNRNWVFTAHSIYFQVLGEQGYIGLLLFLALGAVSFWNASRLRGRTLDNPDTAWLHDLAGMIQVSMVGYAVGGAFLSLAYFDLPYNVMVILVASKYWLREERWKTEKQGAFGSTSAGQARASLPKGKPVLSKA